MQPWPIIQTVPLVEFDSIPILQAGGDEECRVPVDPSALMLAGEVFTTIVDDHLVEMDIKRNSWIEKLIEFEVYNYAKWMNKTCASNANSGSALVGWTGNRIELNRITNFGREFE